MWDAIDRTDCVAVASQYLRRAYRAGVGSMAWAFQIEVESWNAGSRRTNCVLARVNTSGEPVARTGSLKAP